VEVLVAPPPKKDKKVLLEDPKLLKRKTLTYGRLHIDGSPSSFQWKKARFGGEIPIKGVEIVVAGNADEGNEFGCQTTPSAEGSFLVVMRGECSYLEKAEAAESSKAKGLIVVNTDNKDLFEMPAGYDLTPEEIDDLPVLPVVLVPQAAMQALKHIEEHNAFAKALLMPLDCDKDGCFPVYKTDIKLQADYDASGGQLFLTDEKGRDVSFEYVTSTFGSVLPESGQLVLVKSDGGANQGCKDVMNDADDLEGKVVLVKRGGCNFSEKAKLMQQHKARMVVLVNEEGGYLERPGAHPDVVGDLYAPMMMISKRSGDAIERIMEAREAGSEDGDGVDMPWASITKDRKIAVLWEEIFNFLSHCTTKVEKTDTASHSAFDVKVCDRDYKMMRKAAEAAGNQDKTDAIDNYLQHKKEESSEEKEVPANGEL
jgi:hypothetical protein